MLPKKSKSLDSGTPNESHRAGSTTSTHDFHSQLHFCEKVVSNSDPSLKIALLDHVSNSIRNETNIERENQFLEN